MNAWMRARLLAGAVWPVRTLIPERGPVGWLRLPAVLRPDSRRLADPAFLLLHVAASLGVAVRGAAVLLRHDPSWVRTRRALGSGLAQYEIAGWPAPFWVDVRPDAAAGGWGTPPRAFAVRLRFADARQALGVQRGEVDVMAEVGSGRLAVEGRLPLADGLEAVMHQVGVLLGGR